MVHALRNAYEHAWVYSTCDLACLLVVVVYCWMLSVYVLEYCHGYGRFAISYLVMAYAVLASLLHATYDGGEWIPGFVIVLYIFVMSFVAYICIYPVC